MQFVLYSEKTVAQCLTAVNARMHVKGTSSRPALDGWVEKGGAFSIGVTTPVIGKFERRTFLKAKVERQNGVTVVRGSVPSGVAKEGQAIVFAALALVVVVMIASSNVVFGLLLIPFAAYLYIPMRGDYQNSQLLIDEVQKTLKAKEKPPRKAADSKASKSGTMRATAPRAPASRATATRTAAARPTAARPTATRPAAAKLPEKTRRRSAAVE